MDQKTITLPTEKKRLVGLLVTKEELFKDLFIKKKILLEKKQKLHSKGFELGFLKGIIDGRKALKRTIVRDNESPSAQVKLVEGEKITQNSKVSEDSAEFSIVKNVPKLFKIPFYLVNIPKETNIELEMDHSTKKLKIFGQDELTYYPYYKVLGKKASNEAKKAK